MVLLVSSSASSFTTHLPLNSHPPLPLHTYTPSHSQRLKARKASMAELQSIHSENHVRLYARPTQRRPGVEKKDSGRAFIQLSCGGLGVDRDTYWNEHHTSNTARMVRIGPSPTHVHVYVHAKMSLYRYM